MELTKKTATRAGGKDQGLRGKVETKTTKAALKFCQESQEDHELEDLP